MTKEKLAKMERELDEKVAKIRKAEEELDALECAKEKK